MAIFDISSCEEAIGFVFADKILLRQCFTHKSYANEHNTDSNEILEFFGDAIIEFIVTEYLVSHNAGDEGDLTEERKKMVSKTPLLKSVKKMGLDEYMVLGSGLKGGGAGDEKFYSSLYEALVAGIYRDKNGGLSEAKKFILRTIIKDYEEERNSEKKQMTAGANKNELKEYAEKRKLGAVEYVTVSKTGQDHLPTFRVAVYVGGERIAEGKGTTVKNAQGDAAKKALDKLTSNGKGERS